MVSGWMAAPGVHAANTVGLDFHRLWQGFGQLTVDGLSTGVVYALVAVGFTLAFGVLRLINFAHAEVFMLGMFGSYFALDVLFGLVPDGHAYNLRATLTLGHLAVTLLVAMAVSALVSVGLDVVAYGPLRRRGARPLTFLLVAIGMSFAIQEFVHRVLPALLHGYGGNDAQRPIVLLSPHTLFTLGSFDIGGHRIPFPHAVVSDITLLIIVTGLVLAAITDVTINHTKLGRGIRAVAHDPETATLMGVSRERTIVITFIIGGLLAGAAAMLYTLKVPSGVIYSGGFLLGIKALSAAVLGGIGNVRGALLGGLLLGVLENYGEAVFGGPWRDVVAIAVLVLMLTIRPTGILRENLGRTRA